MIKFFCNYLFRNLIKKEKKIARRVQNEYSRWIKIDDLLQRNARPNMEVLIRECRDFLGNDEIQMINRDLHKLRNNYDRKITYNRAENYYFYEEENPRLTLEEIFSIRNAYYYAVQIHAPPSQHFLAVSA